MQTDSQAPAAKQSPTQPDTVAKSDPPKVANPAADELNGILADYVASVPVQLIQRLESFRDKYHS